MTDATEVLREEHRVIEMVLDCLAQMIAQIRDTGSTQWEAAQQALEFFAQFADQCHHHKEEDLLFPALEECGFSAQEGPTAVMRQEHELGRKWIQAMRHALPAARQGNLEAVRAFRDAAVGYLYLLREHIQKEDHCLFPMARQALPPQVHAQLHEQFRQCSSEEHQRWVQVAQELHRQFSTPPEPQG